MIHSVKEEDGDDDEESRTINFRETNKRVFDNVLFIKSFLLTCLQRCVGGWLVMHCIRTRGVNGLCISGITLSMLLSATVNVQGDDNSY